jgi:hypothetical protein
MVVVMRIGVSLVGSGITAQGPMPSQASRSAASLAAPIQ